MNMVLPPQLFLITHGKWTPWRQTVPHVNLPLSTLASRLLKLLKIRELTRDRIGEGFCLMESVLHGVDCAKRCGRQAIKSGALESFMQFDKPVLSAPFTHR
jgi:hypothetical protein